MRTSIFLSVLLCALPALSAKYRIRNREGNCVLGIPEHGDRVVTTASCHHENTILDVDAHINHETSTYGSVSHGRWYIGRSEDGEYLEWGRKEYDWEFPPVHHTPYHTIHVRGHHDYWVDGHVGRPIKLGEEEAKWFFERA